MLEPLLFCLNCFEGISIPKLSVEYVTLWLSLSYVSVHAVCTRLEWGALELHYCSVAAVNSGSKAACRACPPCGRWQSESKLGTSGSFETPKPVLCVILAPLQTSQTAMQSGNRVLRCHHLWGRSY